MSAWVTVGCYCIDQCILCHILNESTHEINEVISLRQSFVGAVVPWLMIWLYFLFYFAYLYIFLSRSLFLSEYIVFFCYILVLFYHNLSFMTRWYVFTLVVHIVNAAELGIASMAELSLLTAGFFLSILVFVVWVASITRAVWFVSFITDCIMVYSKYIYRCWRTALWLTFCVVGARLYWCLSQPFID